MPAYSLAMFAVTPIVSDVPRSTAELLAFHVHPDVLVLVAGMLAVFHIGVRKFGPSMTPLGESTVTRSQSIRFHAGVFAILLVSGWPIHDIGARSLFLFHMIEHLTLAFVIPPLLLTGLPKWLLSAIVRPVLPVVRFFAKPVLALVLFNAVLALLHVPAVLNLMLTSDIVHIAIHSALMGTALFLWIPIVGPIQELPGLPPFYKLGYLFLQSLVPTIPASFLTLGSAPLYPIYEQFPRMWGIGVFEDQVFAGLIMKIGGGFLLWTYITYYFFKWHAEEHAISIRSTRPATRPRQGAS